MSANTGVKPYLIGIAGGSASGKTTFAQQTAQALGRDVQIISHDAYYLPFSELPLDERAQQNFDHPASFDTALLATHLASLCSGENVELPQYSYTQFTRLANTTTITPTKIIIVEGVLVLESSLLREMFDLKLFVDTDDDIRFMRRLKRDIEARGRSIDSVFAQYLQTVKPMHEQFVEPSKKYADVIIPKGGHNAVALEMVVARVKSELAKLE
ncbi:uridine kinase [Ruminococcaceae bacterium OttesenSCG-928-N02]|nr:uridine kinase [Ruminococcaceae bacterium OttesenSCG-928-N02]